ncbi:MAG: hypothetical protein ACI857_003210 [Arenicella sp.]|jgi:hypothetical protein
MKALKLSSLLALFILVSSFSIPNPSVNHSNLSDDEFQVIFRVQIGAYENHVPYDKVEVMRELGKIKTIKQDGKTFYYSKPYQTEQAATESLDLYYKVGFEDAHEVVELEDSFVTLADYHKLLNADPSDPETKGVIRIYKK